jgi:EmrB/QacA subfamily drug resistance transporter
MKPNHTLSTLLAPSPLSAPPAQGRPVLHHPQPKPIPKPTPKNRRWATLAVLCLGVIAVVADNTIINVALPTLSRDLNASTRELQWMVDAYLLVFAGFLLPAGSLGDRFGRKRAFLLGLTILGVASGAAFAANSLPLLILERTVMGIGAAFVFPATLSLLTTTFTDVRERKIAVAIWSGMVGIGVIVGPLAGGLLLEHFSWGSVFLINVPVVVTAIVLGSTLIGESQDEKSQGWDPVGALLSFASILTLVFAIVEAPVQGWTSARTAIVAAAAIALGFIFVQWERRHHSPLVPLQLFADRYFSIPVLGLALASFALFGFVFVATQYFQLVSGLGTFASGTRYLPFAAVLIVCAATSPKVVTRFGVRKVIALGMCLLAAGLGVTTLLEVDTPFMPVAFIAVALLGAGMGFVTAPATELLMSRVPADRAGVGSGVNDAARQIGGALGVAVMGSVFSSSYTRTIGATLKESEGIAPEAQRTVLASPGMAVRVARMIAESGQQAIGEVLLSDVKFAFVTAMHSAAWVAIAGALIGAGLTAMTLRKSTYETGVA